MKRILFMLAGLLFMFASCSDGGSDSPETPKPQPQPEEQASITLTTDIPTGGLVFDEQGGEKSVEFSTNKDWTLSIAATTGGTSWCTVSKESGSKGDATVEFTVAENTEYDDRSVSVTIKAGTASKTFKIVQKGVDALLVTTTTFEVPQEGGIIDVEVKTNIDYQIEISEESKSWIKESSSRTLTTHKHTFEVSACDVEDKRKGEIRIKSGDKEEIVSIYQGKSILILSDDDITVNELGDTISVDLKSNCKFKVQMPDVDWIVDEASSRGMSSHTLKYIVKPNDTYDWRNAFIIYSDLEDTVKDTLVIWQSQLRGIILSENEMIVKAEGEIIEVPLKSNIDILTSIDVDWIKRTQAPDSRALSDKILYFEIFPNEGMNSREAQILFKDYNTGNVKDTLLVYQEALNNNTPQILGVWNATYDNDFYFLFNNDGTGLFVDGNIFSPFKWSIEEKNLILTYDDNLKVQEWEIRSLKEESLVLFNLNETDPDAANPIGFVRYNSNYIFPSVNELSVDAQSQTVDLFVSSNVNVEFIIPDTCNWVSIKKVEDNNNLYQLSVEENNDGDVRYATIVIGQKDGDLKKSIVIKQMQKMIFIYLRKFLMFLPKNPL